MWWSENVLFGMCIIILLKLARLAGSRAQLVEKKLTPKEMLLEYGESRKALYYGRVDPIS